MNIQTRRVTAKKVWVDKGIGSKGPYTRYKLVNEEGDNFTTFKDDIGEKALELQGQEVELDYSESNRGTILVAIRPATEDWAQDPKPEYIAKAQQAQPKQNGKDFRTKEEIRRTAAFGFAVELAQNLGLKTLQDVTSLSERIEPYLASAARD